MRKLQLVVSIFFLSTSLLTLTSISKATAEDIPEPECINATLGDETDCGYNCKESGDGQEAKCAEWPGGKCEASFRSVSCGPPAPANWDRSSRRGDYDWNRERDDDHDHDRDRRDRDDDLQAIKDRVDDFLRDRDDN